MSKFIIRLILVIILAFLEWTPKSVAGSTIFNVIKYGARGDGRTDDTKAFQEAWREACKVTGSTIVVPSGLVFLVKPTIFLGYTCASNIIFQLDGELVAPENADAWASSPQAWILFEAIKGITFQGKGILNGRGSIWWKDSLENSLEGSPNLGVHGSKYSNYISSEDWLQYGKAQRKLPSAKPIALVFSGCSNVIVTGITIRNSPLKHLKIFRCVGVKIFRMNIISPADSPNTDGINLSSAQDVVIHNVNLACGDDCISILGGCSNIEIYDVNCGPGHGFSIGGLGRGNTKDIVYNITVRDSIVQNSLTGVRIKTWQGGSGFVKRINFSNIQVSQVKNPIVIDQYYCDKSKCKNQTSAVAVSGITYQSIRGTYTSRSVYFACSDSFPCHGITLAGIDLNSAKANPASGPFCWKAFGKVLTKTTPPVSCLQRD